MDKSRLQAILEEAFGEQVRSYSGRGMYGRECLALDTDKEAGEVFVAVLEAIEGEHDTTELQNAFQDMRSDQMGMGRIFYWPAVAYVVPS
jgi:hypothetical protein